MAAGGAPAGAIVHGVASEVRLRDIAEVTARSQQLTNGVVSWKMEQLDAFGPADPVLAVDQRIAPPRARTQLGWQPSRPDLLTELEHGSYAVAPSGF